MTTIKDPEVEALEQQATVATGSHWRVGVPRSLFDEAIALLRSRSQTAEPVGYAINAMQATGKTLCIGMLNRELPDGTPIYAASVGALKETPVVSQPYSHVDGLGGTVGVTTIASPAPATAPEGEVEEGPALDPSAWDWCMACGKSLDTGLECVSCGRDWMPLSKQFAARFAQPVQAGWRCFHCDEVFKTKAEARKHFGMTNQVFARCITKMALIGAAPDTTKGETKP